MRKLDHDDSLDKWIVAQIHRITINFFEIIRSESKGKLSQVNCHTQHTIFLNSWVNIFKAINFPFSIENHKDNYEKFSEEFDAFADTMVDEILEICKALKTWEPEQTSTISSERFEESTVV